MDDDHELVDLMVAVMTQKGVTIRGLENEIRNRFGEDARVSRSLISLYLRKRTTPTYEAGYQIAKALGMNIKKAMESIHHTRLDTVLADEKKRYKDFLKSIGKS